MFETPPRKSAAALWPASMAACCWCGWDGGGGAQRVVVKNKFISGQLHYLSDDYAGIPAAAREARGSPPSVRKQKRQRRGRAVGWFVRHGVAAGLARGCKSRCDAKKGARACTQNKTTSCSPFVQQGSPLKREPRGAPKWPPACRTGWARCNRGTCHPCT
jgi:hypothetical protein